VKLNGIAFSPEQPIVVLDGRVMGPGEVIQGFTVVEIQSDRVKLQGHGATVFVTTK
jgi:type II secretory pathway component PulC